MPANSEKNTHQFVETPSFRLKKSIAGYMASHRVIVICLILVFILILSQWSGANGKFEFIPWQEGQYSTYMAEWANGAWESYNISIAKKLDDGQWGIQIVVKSKEREFIILCKAPEKHRPPGKPFEPLSFKVLRGTDIDKKTALFHLTRLMYMFSMRGLYERAESGPRPGQKIVHDIKTSGCCGIDTVSRFTDPWPEMGYDYINDISPQAPVLGITSSSINNGSYRIYLTSYGRNTKDIKGYVSVPTFIDFKSIRQIDHDEFSLSYPATWSLQKSTPSPEYSCQYMSIMGGNIHAGHLLVLIKKGAPQDIKTAYNSMREKKGLDKYKPVTGYTLAFRKEMSFSSTNGTICTIYIYDFKAAGQIGYNIIGLYRSLDAQRLAKVALFVNFSENNSLLPIMPEVQKSFDDILKSFRFREDFL
jgi:hypothetical protein